MVIRWLAYYTHGTKKVIIFVDGVEIELLCELYFTGLWNQENADTKCDGLIDLVSQHIN